MSQGLQRTLLGGFSLREVDDQRRRAVYYPQFLGWYLTNGNNIRDLDDAILPDLLRWLNHPCKFEVTYYLSQALTWKYFLEDSSHWWYRRTSIRTYPKLSARRSGETSWSTNKSGDAWQFVSPYDYFRSPSERRKWKRDLKRFQTLLAV